MQCVEFLAYKVISTVLGTYTCNIYINVVNSCRYLIESDDPISNLNEDDITPACMVGHGTHPIVVSGLSEHQTDGVVAIGIGIGHNDGDDSVGKVCGKHKRFVGDFRTDCL